MQTLFEYEVCIFTALRIYFCLHNETWNIERDTDFHRENNKWGSATHKYCEQIKRLHKGNMELIMEFLREENFNPYGTRKGAVVCASSGTLLPVSLAFVAKRGE